MIVGDWQCISRRAFLRVSQRGDRLVVEARHSANSIVLSQDARSNDNTWDGALDRKDASPGENHSASIYRFELRDTDRLFLSRPWKEEDGALEFERTTGRGGSRSRSCGESPRQPRARLSPRRSADRSRSQSVSQPGTRNRDTSGRGRGARGRSRSSSGGDLQSKLVSELKTRQRNSATVNRRWREFCEQQGRGIFDPRRHDAGFIQEFLDLETRASDAGRSGSPGRGAELRARSPSGGSRSPVGRRDDGSVSRASRGRARQPRPGRRARKDNGDRSRKRRRGRRETGDRGEKRGRGRTRKAGHHRRDGARKRKEASGSPSCDASSQSSDDESSAGSSDIVAAKGSRSGKACAIEDHRKEDQKSKAAIKDRGAEELPRAEKSQVEVARETAEAELAAARAAKQQVLKVQEEINEQVRKFQQDERAFQQTQIARKVQLAEDKARAAEEEAVRKAQHEAAKVREAAIAAARKEAEAEAQQSVDEVQRRTQEEFASRLEPAQAKLLEAQAAAKRAIQELEAATLRDKEQKMAVLSDLALTDGDTVGSQPAPATKNPTGKTEAASAKRRATPAAKAPATAPSPAERAADAADARSESYSSSGSDASRSRSPRRAVEP